MRTIAARSLKRVVSFKRLLHVRPPGNDHDENSLVSYEVVHTIVDYALFCQQRAYWNPLDDQRCVLRFLRCIKRTESTFAFAVQHSVDVLGVFLVLIVHLPDSCLPFDIFNIAS